MTETQWLVSTDLRFLRQCLFRTVDPVSNRKLRLFVVACCRRLWPMLLDHRSRHAVEAAETFAEGKLSQKDVLPYRKVAQDVAREARNARAGEGLAMAARAAAETTATSTHEVSAASDHAAKAVASARYYGTSGPSGQRILDWHQEIATEQREQVPYFLDVFGNPFRPVPLDPAWQTPTVLSLADAAYNERCLPSGQLDLTRLAVLSDTLEEAG